MSYAVIRNRDIRETVKKSLFDRGLTVTEIFTGSAGFDNSDPEHPWRFELKDGRRFRIIFDSYEEGDLVVVRDIELMRGDRNA